jgi:hypothetical protein
MEPDLLGYLLNALDSDERRAIDQHLENHHEARQQLVGLRRLLRPLADENEVEYEPSAEMFFKTLRAIAVERGRAQAKQAVASSRSHRVVPPSPVRPARWRRADVLVAACIALIVVMLVPPAVLQLRQRELVAACSNNLSQFHSALQNFADDHQGLLPAPDFEGPLNNAGIYAAKLRDAGYWTGNLRVNCPSNVRHPRPAIPPPTLEEICAKHTGDRQAYENCLRAMGGCYAFNLGYEEGGKYQAVQRQLGDDVPVMSDRPYRAAESTEWRFANSPNHGGRGQNILFNGGHVRFVTSRMINQDDLFLNRDGRLAPGRGIGDNVLAPSETRTRPEPPVGTETD